MKTKKANHKRRPMPEVIVSERGTPICKKMDCDIEENPSHWVDIELAQPYKSAPELLETVKALYDRLVLWSDTDNFDEYDEQAIEKAQGIIAKAEGKC